MLSQFQVLQKKKIMLGLRRNNMKISWTLHIPLDINYKYNVPFLHYFLTNIIKL